MILVVSNGRKNTAHDDAGLLMAFYLSSSVVHMMNQSRLAFMIILVMKYVVVQRNKI